MSGDPRSSRTWRAALPGDVDRISAIEREVHTLAPERPEVFREKLELFGEGCRVLAEGDAIVGYGLAFPWMLDDVPALNTTLGALPSAPQCLFIHDVALLPAARAQGAGGAFVRHVADTARRMEVAHLALVSVYDTHHLWGRCGFAVRPSPPCGDKLAPYGETARYMVSVLT